MNPKKWLLLTIISVLLVFFVYPSAFIYTRDTLPDNNDTRLIAYIIGQVQQNLLKGQPLHHGTYFSPDKDTLAYSETFLTSALITLPARLITEHPVIIFNIALVLGSVLTIVTSFLLFEYLFKDIWITSLTTLLFNFSGYHLSYLPHLQMFSLWPACLSIYFLLRYLKEERSLFLIYFFATVTAQLAESIFPAYLIFFTTLIIFIGKLYAARALANNRTQADPACGNRVRFWRGLKRKQFAEIFIYSLPFIPLWLFLLYPYYHLHISLPEATRPIRDAAHFSLGLEQILTFFHSWTVIILFLISILAKTFYFLGELTQPRNAWPRLLSGFRGEYVDSPNPQEMRNYRSQQKVEVDSQNSWMSKTFQITFWFALIMSLGPVLKVFGNNIRMLGFPIPLPYALFYYLFPGFTGFRTPSRFIILALLSAVIIIGYNLQPIFTKLKSKTKFIFILLVLSLLFFEADLPLKGYPVNINMHPVYEQVKNLPPEAVILELPIKLWNMPDHEIESVRSLYTLEHLHHRFGGYSGFATNNWINLVERINTYGLSPEIVKELKSLGITHVIENNKLKDLF